MHSIDEMAKAACTSVRGVRYYEEKGLLGEVERTAGGTRRYTDEQLDRGRIIAAAAFGGWKLEDIAEMLDEYHKSTDVYEAIMSRISDQARAAVRLGDALPMPAVTKPETQEFDL